MVLALQRQVHDKTWITLDRYGIFLVFGAKGGCSLEPVARKAERMKTSKHTWIGILVISAWIHAGGVSATADDMEKWQKSLEKDYAEILNAAHKKLERHRGLVNKWREKGHLPDLIRLYEADATAEGADADVYYGLGYAYAIQGGDGTLEKAETQFQRAIALQADLPLAHYSLGGVYQQQGKYEQALQEMETCIRLIPQNLPAYYKQGEIYLQQDRLDEAFKSFKMVLGIKPNWVYAYYGLGSVYLKRGELNAARATFEKAIRRNEKFAPAYFKLGQVLASENRFEEALKAYKDAAKHQAYTAEVLYELGAIFAQKGNPDGAINLYRRAIAIDPNYAPAHLQLGDIYYINNQHDLALEHYKRAFEAEPATKDYFIKRLAPYHAGEMAIDEAKSLLDRTLALNPEEPRGYFYYAQVEVDAGNPTAAIQHYEKTIELIEADKTHLETELPAGDFLDAYLSLGNLYYQAGNHQSAATAYRRAIELAPERERHFFDQGKTAYDAEQFDQAIEPLNKFLLIYPEDIEAAYILGRSYEAKGDLDNALRRYTQTIQLDPNHKDVLMRSAQIYRKQTNPQSALVTLEKLIAIDPTNVDALYLSGLTHIQLNRPDDALAAFLETARLDPNHVDAHYQGAMLYEQKGDIDNTLDLYERTIQLDASRADALLRVGAIYLQRGDVDNLVRVYEGGLAIEPNHPLAQYDLAAIFEERAEIEKAIVHFGLANQHGDSRYDWHYRYARLLDRHARTLEDYDKYAGMAVEEYSRTIALKSDYAPAYFHRGLIARRYKQIGDELFRYSQIAEDFKKVIALEPKNADAHYYLGMTNLDLDQRDKAKEVFQKTRELDPTYKDVSFQLGGIAEGEHKYKEAIQHYEAEVAINPKSVKTYQRLGDLYGAYVLDFGRAKEILEKALELEPDHAATLLNYGNTLYHLNQLGSATEQFERLIQLDPKDPSANYNLALMYEYTGKTQQAIDRWKKFLKLNPPSEWKAEAEGRLRQLGAKP